MVYEIKCAWCGESMGTRECEENLFAGDLREMGLPIVSHGICPDCCIKVLEDAELSHKGGYDE